MVLGCWFFFFFFNDAATTEIYTLSLHDALPIWRVGGETPPGQPARRQRSVRCAPCHPPRSEEHTSELQSHLNLVCRLLLEKKKKKKTQKNKKKEKQKKKQTKKKKKKK